MPSGLRRLYSFGADFKHNLAAAFARRAIGGLHYENRAALSQLRARAESKSSPDLFVLGSSPSVLNLDEKRLAHIQRSFSIGVGFWVFHPFVADAYYFEGAPDQQGWDLWREYMALRSAGPVKPLLLVEPVQTIRSHSRSHLSDLLRQFEGQAYPTRIFAANAASAAALRLAIAGHRAGLTGSRLMHFRSAVSTAMDIAARLPSVERVILVGVDLRDRRYFWNSMGIQYKWPGYQNAQQVPHSTVVRQGEFDNLPIIDFIREFNRNALKPRGKSLLVSSSESVLAEFLPIWSH